MNWTIIFFEDIHTRSQLEYLPKKNGHNLNVTLKRHNWTVQEKVIILVQD